MTKLLPGFYVVMIWLLAVTAGANDNSDSTNGLSPETQPIAELQGKWIGTLEQYSHEREETVPMILTIDHIDGQEFTGTMDWPGNNGCKTKVIGGFDGTTVKWTETEYIHGKDGVLYGLYVATFNGKNKISGSWMDPKHTIYPQGPKYGVPGASFTLEKR